MSNAIINENVNDHFNIVTITGLEYITYYAQDKETKKSEFMMRLPKSGYGANAVDLKEKIASLNKKSTFRSLVASMIDE